MLVVKLYSVEMSSNRAQIVRDTMIDVDVQRLIILKSKNFSLFFMCGSCGASSSDVLDDSLYTC